MSDNKSDVWSAGLLVGTVFGFCFSSAFLLQVDVLSLPITEWYWPATLSVGPLLLKREVAVKIVSRSSGGVGQ